MLVVTATAVVAAHKQKQQSTVCMVGDNQFLLLLRAMLSSFLVSLACVALYAGPGHSFGPVKIGNTYNPPCDATGRPSHIGVVN